MPPSALTEITLKVKTISIRSANFSICYLQTDLITSTCARSWLKHKNNCFCLLFRGYKKNQLAVMIFVDYSITGLVMVLDVRQFYVVFDKKHITQDLRPLSRQQQLTKDKPFVTSDNNSLKKILSDSWQCNGVSNNQSIRVLYTKRFSLIQKTYFNDITQSDITNNIIQFFRCYNYSKINAGNSK